MTVTIGTSSGFCSSSPSSDPGGGIAGGLNPGVIGVKDTSPSTAAKITEIGWWCDTASTEANWEAGIYEHDGTYNCPGAKVGSFYQTNAKGTTAGWKKCTTDIAISASTIYWIVVQVDTASPQTYTNGDSGSMTYVNPGGTTLPDPWTDHGSGTFIISVYAVWEAAQSSINIGDAWKAVDFANSSINIGDAWKTISAIQVNIGDVWKTVYGTP